LGKCLGPYYWRNKTLHSHPSMIRTYPQPYPPGYITCSKMADENVLNGANAPDDIVFFSHAYSDADIDKLTSLKEEGELLFPKGKQYPSPQALRDELRVWASKKGFSITSQSSSFKCSRGATPQSYLTKKQKRGPTPEGKQRNRTWYLTKKNSQRESTSWSIKCGSLLDKASVGQGVCWTRCTVGQGVDKAYCEGVCWTRHTVGVLLDKADKAYCQGVLSRRLLDKAYCQGVCWTRRNRASVGQGAIGRTDYAAPLQ
jgi:hypothetical protein